MSNTYTKALTDYAESLEPQGTSTSQTFRNEKDLLIECIKYFDFADANPLRKQVINWHKGKAKHAYVDIPRPYLTEGLCVFLGIQISTWQDWRERDDFGAVCKMVDAAIRDQKLAGAMAGFYNALIASRVMGLVDKTETEVKGGISLSDTSEKELNDRISRAFKALKGDDKVIDITTQATLIEQDQA